MDDLKARVTRLEKDNRSLLSFRAWLVGGGAVIALFGRFLLDKVLGVT